MRYYDDGGWGMHDGGWWMGLTWLIVLVVLIAVGVWVAVTVLRGQQHGAGHHARSSADPEGILAERLARGEIEPDEYASRLRALRDAGR